MIASYQPILRKPIFLINREERLYNINGPKDFPIGTINQYGCYVDDGYWLINGWVTIQKKFINLKYCKILKWTNKRIFEQEYEKVYINRKSDL